MKTYDRARRWVGPALLFVAFVSLAAWSWRKWADPFIDFGRELYVPWQLAAGKVLYRDIASLFGPFSQYLNAALFKLAGTSFLVLVAANLTILAGMTALIYALFRDTCDRLTATLAGLILLCVFGFSQYLIIGNYNFISPYSHEATHGVALSVAMIFCLHRFQKQGRVRWIALSGLCLGLVVLTKPEVSLAAMTAAGAGFVLFRLGTSSGDCPTHKLLAVFCGVSAIPCACFLAYFAARMPIAAAVKAVCGAWSPLFLPEVAGSGFYDRVMGFDKPVANLAKMIRMLLVMGFLAGAGAVADFATHRPRRAIVVTACIVSVGCVFAILLVTPTSSPLHNIGRPLPLLVIAALYSWVRSFWRARQAREATASLATLIMWSAFSLVLLAKMGLNTRLVQYGFCLAMPASLTILACAVYVIPETMRRRWGGGAVFRMLSVAMVGLVILHYLTWSQKFYKCKIVPVGSGSDTFYCLEDKVIPMAGYARDTLRFLETRSSRHDTMVGFPEGVMLNYLSRTTNPTPYITLMPPELRAFGERAILQSLQGSAPDLIVLTSRDMSEYGVSSFGTSPANGLEIMKWVEEDYRVVHVIGAEPVRNGRPAIQIMERESTE